MVQLNEEAAVPNGVYPVECIKNELKVSKAGAPMWAMEHSIIDGVHSQTLYDYVVFSPKAMGMAIQKLRALGYNVSSGQSFDENNTQSAIGRKAMATVESEEYEGRMSPKIKSLAPFRAGEVTGPQAGAAAGQPDYGNVPF